MKNILIPEGWKYYNHALVPMCAPHEEPNIVKTLNGKTWKTGGVFFARWTTDFDCNEQTEFWYCIKDTPFCLNSLNAKKRYEITRGLREFDIKIINLAEYIDQIFTVRAALHKTYPKQYIKSDSEDDKRKITINIQTQCKDSRFRSIGAFVKGTDILCGYADIVDNGSYYDFVRMVVNPEYERFHVNAALVYGILENIKEDLEKGKYISDGSRNVSHITKFQDYLVKYFGFRYAYCRLMIKYRPIVGFFVGLLYPFRRCGIFKLKNNKIYLISSLLFQEELRRQTKKK